MVHRCSPGVVSALNRDIKGVVMIMVLTPITCPRLFNNGPPLFPGLMLASVWMQFLMSLPATPLMSRFNALTTPVVTVRSRPNGLPMATTLCPTSRSSLEPNSSASKLSFVVSFLDFFWRIIDNFQNCHVEFRNDIYNLCLTVLRIGVDAYIDLSSWIFAQLFLVVFIEQPLAYIFIQIFSQGLWQDCSIPCCRGRTTLTTVFCLSGVVAVKPGWKERRFYILLHLQHVPRGLDHVIIGDDVAIFPYNKTRS